METLVVPTLTPDAVESRTILYTPTVSHTPRRIATEVEALERGMDMLVEEALHHTDDHFLFRERHTALLIVDEADRLQMTGLEQRRHLSDRGHAAIVQSDRTDSGDQWAADDHGGSGGSGARTLGHRPPPLRRAAEEDCAKSPRRIAPRSDLNDTATYFNTLR